MEKIVIQAVLTESSIQELAQKVDINEMDKQYKISKYINFPFLDFSDEQQTYLLKGDIHIDGLSVTKQDWSPFNLIIDGNLTVEGTINWNEWGNGSFLYVTGNLETQNLFLAGCPEAIIKGNLIVEKGLVGSQGDNGGSLIVSGDTKAELIYCTTYFNMEFPKRPTAFIIAESDNFIFNSDINEDDFKSVQNKIKEECQPDEPGIIDVDEIKDCILAGTSIFKETVS